MRLINVNTLQLEEFFGEDIPEYVILSHTWGEDEVSFDDWLQPNVAQIKIKGYAKIIKTCDIARSRFGVNYVWVDTTCIDKRSSSELSEAINSMFAWYRGAKVCLAYLADVELGETADRQPKEWELAISQPNWHPGKRFTKIRDQFNKSRWFTRGWTLQELLAPRVVLFLSKDWQYIATRSHLRREISELTNIPDEALISFRPESYTVASTMSWASGRSTTRVEDMAYCLMGIFDINMPLLYGEGRKAFRRLQEEIIKVSNDQSIFAWSLVHDPLTLSEVLGFVPDLAPSPESFSWILFKKATKLKFMRLKPYTERSHYMMTNSGLRITVPLVPTQHKGMYLMPISFALNVHDTIRQYFVFMKTSDGVHFERDFGFPLPVPLKLRLKALLEYRTVYITRGYSPDLVGDTTSPALYRWVIVAVFWKYQSWNYIGFATLEPSDQGWVVQDKAKLHYATLSLQMTNSHRSYCRVFQLWDPKRVTLIYVLVGSRPSYNRKKQLWKAYVLPDRPSDNDTYDSLFDAAQKNGSEWNKANEETGGPRVFLQYPYWGEVTSLMPYHHPVVCVMHTDAAEDIEEDVAEEDEFEEDFGDSIDDFCQLAGYETGLVEDG